MPLHIVTVANKSQYYYPYLVQSCKDNGIALEVLGFGETFEGLNWKNKKMIDYLKTKGQRDLVCFIDGFDVICVRNLQQLEAAYQEIQAQTGCKIAVAEDRRSPGLDWMATLYFGTCKNQSINSGTYIGYAPDLLSVIEATYALNPTNDMSDQISLTNYCKQDPDAFYIDTEAKLFLTLLYPLQDLRPHIVLERGVVTYKGERPFFVHAAGYGFLDTLLQDLGYSVDDTIQNSLWRNFFTNKILMYFRYVCRMIWLPVLILLVVLTGIYYRRDLQQFIKRTLSSNRDAKSIIRFNRGGS
jgi:hypothetical protein